MSNNILLLVDNTIPDTNVLKAACLPNVSFILYDATSDTYTSILENIKALNIISFSEVGFIFEYDPNTPIFQLLQSQTTLSIVNNVQTIDPTLDTWSDFSGFLNSLKTNYGTNTFDFFDCNLYSNLNWQYIFNTLDSRLGILIQASRDVTGNATYGGNWLMESDNVNLQPIYFNTNINTYQYTFAGVPSAPTIINVTAGNVSANVAFTAGGNNGNTLTNYYYTINGGTSYISYGGNIPASTFTISTLNNGQQYTVNLMAHNYFGNSAISGSVNVIPATIPGQPTISPNIIVGNCSATITIIPSTFNSGNTITNYYYSIDGGTSFTSIGNELPGNTYTISQLTNGQPYIIDVIASNYYGNSTVSGNVTIIPATNPGQPTISPNIIVGNCSATITIIPSTFNSGNTITNYYYSTDGGNSFTSIGNELPGNTYTISQLINGQTYIVDIIASNYYGNSAVSRNVTVIPATVPEIPGNINITTGSGQAKISFTPGSNGGNIINNYYYSINGGTSFISTDNALLGNTYTINGLINGNSYSIELMAANAQGNSAITSNIDITPIGVPYQPTITNTVVGNSQAIISFTSGSNGGNTIINYGYSLINISKGNLVSGNILSGSITSPIIINNLLNGNTYIVNLFAINYYGNGVISGNVVVTPNNIVPYAPTITNSLPGQENLIINYTPGYDGNNPIKNYEYSTDGGKTFNLCNPSGNTIIIGNLSTINPYSVEIFAINSVGNGIVSNNYPITYPSEPININYVPGNEEVIINFDSGYNGGYPISNYYYSLNGQAYISADTITSPLTIDRLVNGNTYSINIFATNINGNGIVSGNILVTPSTIPSEPTNLIATPENQSAIVTFTPPINYGGNTIINYGYSINCGIDFTLCNPPINPQNNTGNTITIGDLSNGVTYLVELFAQNSNGNGIASDAVSVTPATIPSAITVNNVIIGNSTAIINFTPGSTGGSNITNYQYSLDGGNTLISLGQPINNQIIIGNLSNGSTYSIQLYAQNSMGTALISENISVIPSTIPDSPIINTILPGDKQAYVYFTPPVDTGGNTIITYDYSFDYGNTIFSANTINSPIIINNLLNGNTYNVNLIAVNYYGNSPISGSFQVTPNGVVPYSPINLTALPNNKQVTVSFIPGYDGGNKIINYEYSLDGCNTFISYGLPIGNTITIGNLVNGNTYSISLYAVNSIGNGQISGNVYVTPATIPSAPIISNIISGNKTAIINFIPGFNGGNTIINYDYSLDNGKTYLSYGLPIGNTITIGNLINGEIYSVELFSVNYVGNGTPSNSVSVIPVNNVPSVPTNIMVSPGNEELTINFKPGSNGGYSILKYEYSINGSPYISTHKPINPIVIGNLINGNTYSINFFATNINGNGVATGNFLATPATTPSIPTNIITIPSNNQAIVNFTPGYNGGNAIINYQYSTGGSIFNSCNPPVTIGNTITIGNLVNGNPYLIEFFAVNSIGKGVISGTYSVMPATVPSVPGNIIITPNDRYATISYSPSYNGGNIINNYYYSINGGYSYTSVGLPLDNIITIGNLTNGINYNIQLFAANSMGNGISSGNISVVQAIPPSAPIITNIIPGNNKITINFTPGSNGGNIITNYNYSLDGGNAFKTYGLPKGNIITINNLTNGNTYLVELFATNIKGNGSISGIFPVVPATVPIVPGNIKVIPGNNSANITFIPGYNGGNTITNYYYSIDGGNTFTSAGVSLGNIINIPNLINGNTYFIELYAQNYFGNSQISGMYQVIPATVPSSPTIIRVTPGNQYANIAFTPPISNGGNKITNYEYSTDGGNTYLSLGIPNNNMFTIGNLVNGKNYLVDMLAVNSYGNSQISGIYQVIPATVPSVPGNIIVTPGNKKTNITFTPGYNGGNTIFDYEYSLDGGSTFTSVGLPPGNLITVNNLINGKIYLFDLLATNYYGNSAISGNVSIITARPPYSPTIINAASGNKKATISFIPGDDGYNPIINYEYSVNGGIYDGNTFTSVGLPVGNTFTIGNLTNGIQYSIELLAVNAIGNGDITDNCYVTPNPTFPSPPVITSVTTGNKQAQIYFIDGDDNGSPITTYYYSINGRSLISITPVLNSFTIYNLINSITYNIQLFSHNNYGYSQPSNIVSFTPTSRLDMIEYCQVRDCTQVNYKKIVTGGNNPQQSCKMQYAQSIKNTKPVTVYTSNTEQQLAARGLFVIYDPSTGLLRPAVTSVKQVTAYSYK